MQLESLAQRASAERRALAEARAAHKTEEEAHRKLQAHVHGQLKGLVHGIAAQVTSTFQANLQTRIQPTAPLSSLEQVPPSPRCLIELRSLC